MKNLGLGFDLGKKMNRTQDCELVNGLSFTRPGGRAPVLRGRTAAGEDREALPECRQSSATTAGVSQGREDRRSKTGHCRSLARRRGFWTGVAAAAPAAVCSALRRPRAALNACNSGVYTRLICPSTLGASVMFLVGCCLVNRERGPV